jgi:hypothetical protein
VDNNELWIIFRAVVMREKASRTYAIGPYFLAKFFADLPINVLLPLVSQTILFVSSSILQL